MTWAVLACGAIVVVTEPLTIALLRRLMVIDLPEGKRVSYSPWGRRAFTQQLLLLQGRLTVFVGDKRFDLDEGDCLDFDVMRPVAFENSGRTPASYIVIVRHT